MKTELIDAWMPVWDFNSFHSIEIDAPVDVVYDEMKSLDLTGGSLTGVLFALRSLSTWVFGGRYRKPLKFTLDGLEEAGFVTLEEDRACEIVIGFLGRPWMASGDIRRVTPGEFRTASNPELAKVVMNFRVEAEGTRTRLTTETRGLSLSEVARRSFRRYWMLIAPFSGMVRVEALWKIKACAERRHSRTMVRFP